MALSDKLYELRRKSGLSQEQLAEQLNVSRQAISKWESGQSVPETEKLLAISAFFDVSLDCLMKGDIEVPPAKREEYVAKAEHRKKWTVGMISCIGGIIGLLLWGMLSILLPSAAEQMRESSMIQIDGNGIFLILCVSAVVFGAVLLVKNTSKK